MQREPFYKNFYWGIRNCFSFKGKRVVQTYVRFSLCTLIVCSFLPIDTYGQFWALFATNRMITTDDGEFWPLRTFVPPPLTEGIGQTHTIEIYKEDKLSEKVIFDNKGRVQSKTKYLQESEWYGLEKEGFGATNHYGYAESRTIDSTIGKGLYNKEYSITPPVEYREINAGMEQLKALGTLFFSYSKGLFLQMASFEYSHKVFAENIRAKKTDPYTPIVTYQGDPKQAVFCYSYPEVKKIDTEHFYEVLYPNEKIGSSNYSFDLFGLFKIIGASSIMDKGTIASMLGMIIPLDTFLSSYFKGTEYNFIYDYADRTALASQVITYRDTSYNLVAFEGERNGTKVKGYNFQRGYFQIPKGIVEFEIPNNSHHIKRIIFAMERNLDTRSGLEWWDEISIFKWQVFIVGEEQTLFFTGDGGLGDRHAFVIPAKLTDGCQVKQYTWYGSTENYTGTPYSHPVAHIKNETTFNIKIK